MERRTISKEVYGRVISLIPQEIIDMLPEKPEKLLPYATRTKEVQVTTGINDDVRDLMQEYLLSDEEYLKTFFYVMAITFYNKVPVENPEIAIVAAQTGSGKSNLTAKLLRKNDNYIFVDSDKYKHFRFDAQEIAKRYPVIYPHLTASDGYDHAADIYEYAIDKKYNIIKESAPSAKKGLVDLDRNVLKAKNYRISVHILAVGELNSLLSVHERYELQIIHGLKTAKLTGIPRHDESYNVLIQNVKDIESDKDISSINIYVRGINEEGYNTKQIYPSDKFASTEEAIISARKIDNEKTIKEFEPRYSLVLEEMNKRNAPQAQYEQLEKIRERWEKLKIV